MLDDTELDAMRAAIGDLLPDTCNILSGTETSDGAGGVTIAWGTVGALVACRLDHVSGSEQISGGAVQPFRRSVMSLPYSSTLTPASRIEHGGYTYTVRVVNTDQSWPLVMRVEVDKV